MKNLKGRTSITKFRLSNHKLMIEKRKTLKLGINERKYPFAYLSKMKNCHDKDCHVYSPLRNELIVRVEKTVNIVNLKGTRGLKLPSFDNRRLQAIKGLCSLQTLIIPICHSFLRYQAKLCIDDVTEKDLSQFYNGKV